MKIRVNISVDKDVFKKFKKACKDDGAKVSSKLERLMSYYVTKYRFNILKV